MRHELIKGITMHHKLIIAFITLALILPSAVVGATDYTIDKDHSSVSFKVAHMVVSKTRGAFTDFSGKIILADDITASSVNVTIKVSSVDTANSDRDEHLLSEDFFNSEKYPAITFKSTKIKKHGDHWVAHGDLTLKGVTKRVALPFEITGKIMDPWGNERIGIDIEPVTIDRQDYGISFSKTMEAGGLMVGNDVTIKIELEAIKAK